MQVLSLGDNLFGGNCLHSANINLSLEAGKVCLKLLCAIFERFVELAESHAVELAVLVKPIYPLDFSPRFLKLRAL